MTTNNKPSAISRRRFIGQAAATVAGATSLAAMQLNMEAVQAAAMANPDVSGYKAMVCILLAGGNDSFNMLVPYADHAQYVTARGGIHGNGGVALPKSELIPIGDGGFAVHDSLAAVSALYDSDRLAFLANTGPLVTPLVNGSNVSALTVANTPRGLFSHSDQINAWHVVGGNGTGVMGRVGDVYRDTYPTGLRSISGNISVAGTNLMQRGDKSRHYTLSSTGPVSFSRTNRDASRSLSAIYAAIGSRPGSTSQTLYNSNYGGSLKQAYARHMESAVANAEAFTTGYKAASDSSTLAVGVFNSKKNKVSAQLEVVARSIEMQRVLSPQDQVGRQVFFVLMGGWDDHSNLIKAHRARLAVLNEALSEFAQGLEAIGRWDDVVTFTVSDFGRTLRSNGTGTDHGWGGNHMIMGGPVRGKSIYGKYPSPTELMPGSYLDSTSNRNGAGRMIPTTSADEYMAELAQWFGVPISRMTEVVPNLDRFYTRSSAKPTPLGFLN